MTEAQLHGPGSSRPGDQRPNPGPQEATLRTEADIGISGGAYGGGKTWSLLVEPLRHAPHTPGFGAVIFRRTMPRITAVGGMWSESQELYMPIGGRPRQNPHRWNWDAGGEIRFSALQYERDVYDEKGSQIALLCFDQVEEFTEFQFFYMLSRNRSTCGVAPYVRATCNPVPDDDPVGGWLHKLIGWWIDDEGYPIAERSGVLRWMLKDGEEWMWGDSLDEVEAKATERGVPEHHIRSPDGHPFTKSVTFIPAFLTDNPVLMRKDPGYMGNLMQLPLVERLRGLGGNWKVRASSGLVFNRDWFPVIDRPVDHYQDIVRYWDTAGTAGGGAYTVGCKLGRWAGGWDVLDVARAQVSKMQRHDMMRATAERDGGHVVQVIEQQPGSAGMEVVNDEIKTLAGYTAKADKVTGSKDDRMGPVAAQAERGHVRLLRAEWNDQFLSELHNIPDGRYRDQGDALSGGFNYMETHEQVNAPTLPVLARQPYGAAY